jgi:hypothetical protein
MCAGVAYRAYRFAVQHPGTNCGCPVDVRPNETVPTHWLAGEKSLAADVHATRLKFAPAGGVGQLPVGGPIVEHIVPLFIAWLQNRSVEYAAVRQKPLLQSASERHGEHKPPSPRHTPARGMHTLSGWTHR